jgi:AraC family transcriptional regulator of adaptative response/methylated-DNA-[protein]-cysteine methyltransferase
MLVCATNEGICLLEFVDRKSLESEFKELKCKLNARIIAGENQHITHAKQQLTEYFANQRSSFSVPLDLQGTPFQLQVWQGLLAICYGKTAYYQQQAKSIGKPTAVSAVAAANQHNKVAIIVPCHRLVCKSGKPTGYGGSVERKEWLLDHEQS